VRGPLAGAIRSLPSLCVDPQTRAFLRDETCFTRAVDMLSTCKYAPCMSKMIQIRHVPDELHRKLKARAAIAGLSLSDYALGELRRAAERPTVEEMKQRLGQRRPVRPAESPAEAVRAERDRR
jgi:plasmid stability protein